MGKRERPYARVSKTPLASAVRWALVAATLVGSTSAVAQTAEPAAAPATTQSSEEATTLDTVSVLGSRGQPRTVSSSAVPIDIISAEEFRNQGSTDALDQLRVLVPSFNVSTIPIDDAASLVRPANLRGLPPDNTLVLVNGKRFHRSAVITFLGHGLSDGSQGPDLSVFPSLALE
jgi:iron complex outermembrane receptor protein